jgi:hypothetical protein
MAASAMLPLAGGFSLAAPAKPNVIKAASWLFGSKLSLAAIGHGRNVKKETVDRLLNDANSIGKELGVDVKPFPPKSDTDAKTMATLIHYLIKGDGWSSGNELVKKYSREHGILFEVAVKSNLLLILYIPGNDSGIASIIQSRFQEIKVPRKLWGDLVDKVNRKDKVDAVNDAVFTLHKEVTTYYLDM